LCSVLAGVWAPAQATAVVIQERPTENPGLQLLYQGKINEAAQVLELGINPGGSLANHASQARAPAARLGFSEAYLQLFPFGYLTWEEDKQKEWGQVALGYLLLLERTEKPEAEWYRQSLAARGRYEELRQAYEKKDAKEYTRLADEIVAKYPLSIFCQAAIMTVCWGRSVKGHGGAFENGADLLRGYLAQMEKVAIPEKDRLLVMLLCQSRQNHRDVTDGRVPTRFVMAADIVRLTTNPFMRRAYLGEEIHQFLLTHDRPKARDCGLRFLDQFPIESRPEGWMKLVYVCLGAATPEEAVWWIGKWREEQPKADLAPALVAVADHYSAKGEWGSSIRHHEEAAGFHPGSRVLPQAMLGLARAHGALGNEGKMVSLLKQVTALPATDTTYGVMDAGNTRNHAYQALAQHYMKNGDWAEALMWWQRWQPTSWCSTCAQALRKQREENIASCMKLLKGP
jgi:hypothetical protein